MTDTYREVGFDARRIGFGERPGIAVVDFQKGFTRPEFRLGGRPLVERAVTNSALLLKAARAANLPVATCYTAYTSERDMPYWKIAPVLKDFVHGNAAVELDERIYEQGYDAVVCKTGPSIFFQTPVAAFFIKERVDTVIIVGCNTSGCVRASVNDAFSYGYRVIVPEPCVGDVEEGPHRDNLRDVGRRYADVVGLEEVLDYIETIRRRNAA
jgi:maleamate amidohydrolase